MPLSQQLIAPSTYSSANFTRQSKMDDAKPREDVAYIERRGSDDAEGVSDPKQKVNQDKPDIYIEALARYPNDEAIDAADERRLVRKLDMRILPLLGICYFFYYVDKTTL